MSLRTIRLVRFCYIKIEGACAVDITCNIMTLVDKAFVYDIFLYFG